METAAYFVVPEAITNALRHSRAGHLSVRLKRGTESLVVDVRDDGLGAMPDGAGAGLRSPTYTIRRRGRRSVSWPASSSA